MASGCSGMGSSALPGRPQLGGQPEHLGPHQVERGLRPRPQLGRLHVDAQGVAELVAVQAREPSRKSPVACGNR